MYKKILALIFSAILLTACERGIDGEDIIESITSESETVSVVQKTTDAIDIVFPAETTAETTQTEETSAPVTYSDEPTRYMTEIERYFYEQGYGDYYEDSKALHMDLSNLIGEESYVLSKEYSIAGENPYFAEVESIRITNYAPIDWSFIGQFKNLKSLRIEGEDVDVTGLTEYVHALPLEEINVDSNSYYTDSANVLMAMLPDCVMRFTYQTSHSTDAYERVNSGGKINRLVFFTQPNLELTGSPAEEWVCTESEIKSAYYDYYNPSPIWRHKNNLVFNFANYTQDACTVDSVQLFKGFNGGEPVMFKDGTDSLTVGLEIDAMTRNEYVITDDMLDYSALDSGFYLLCFTCGDIVLEQNVFIMNSVADEMDFLTDEQNEVFSKALSYINDYFGCDGNLTPEEAEALTVEEFVNRFCDAFTYKYAYEKCEEMYIDENGSLISNTGGRGSSIVLHDEYFLPVYADEENVVFQLVVVNAHSDMPYGAGYESMNNHMLKTEDGWRFDNFRIWY